MKLVIFFICGGGSALLCGSEKELNSGQKIFKDLTSKGADILEINTVRKYISEVKGGGLAKLAYPATVVSLIISDVLGNDLASVASGPTVYNRTTKKDAERILRKFNPQPTTYNSQLIETVKDKKYFKKVKNILFVSNKDAVLAMKEKAEKLGFKTKIKSLVLRGEAKGIFAPIAKKIKKGEAILAGGESTVKLKVKSLKLKGKKQGLGKALRQAPTVAEAMADKQGKGGRNQESILGALVNLRESAFRSAKICVLAVASDGHDNTEAAGAIGDILTIQKARGKGLDLSEYLKRHDSFNFFKKTGDSIFVKRNTFNVADLMIILKDK